MRQAFSLANADPGYWRIYAALGGHEFSHNETAIIIVVQTHAFISGNWMM